ncbi:MAG: hypothetical protein OEM15_06150 [Myxococcales bacterium]|nr:hypothetical protein [Myxococcales bacterium]MDH3485289.1 hypothetical protein [Myxococcales bacterium]
MRNKAFGFLTLMCAGLWVLGCGSDSPCPAGEISCDGVCIPAIDPVLEGPQGIQENIFSGPGPVGSCTASSCHGTQNPQEMLELSSAAVSAENLIDVESEQVPGKGRVVPGDVSASYLYNKITGEGIAPDTQPMPFGGSALCDEKILAVEAWIAAGAP